MNYQNAKMTYRKWIVIGQNLKMIVQILKMNGWNAKVIAWNVNMTDWRWIVINQVGKVNYFLTIMNKKN